ncbi:MAG: class I SAM-dependent methyltransferase [Bacilli bacterium]|nr:class I SAM-dependent methyltransferase [Bacilli bacterium]
MNEKELITYYNKFNEDKRLNTKHGQIEFLTSIKYIEKYLKKNDKIIDIGAGTGKYSKYFYDKGYDVTAVELVKHNLRVIEEKGINAILGNATNLSKFDDESFDITILFGPMYHLISMDEKIKALKEVKRITKTGGYIFVSYCMNEYALITHGFIDNNIKESISNNLIDNNYKITPKENDLYSFVRIEDIDYLKDIVNLKREKIVSQDGPTEYIKKTINKMDEETFNIYLNYHLSICERKELLGSGRHILDILKKDSI